METITQVTIELYKLHIKFTSSTAQGGGGSFKNSKPIGEVDCCESRMAGQIHWWTERWLAVGVVFSGVAAMVAVVTSLQLLDVVWCSAVVVVGVVVVSVVEL